MGVQKKVSEKEGPFTLDVLKKLQLTGLVVQTAGVLQDRLMAVPEEALTTVVALQVVYDD